MVIQVILLTIMIAGVVEAKDLGVFGQTFEISENDLLEYIRNKLMKMNRSGELKKLQKEIISRMKDQVINPKEVEGIGLAKETIERKYDPTIIVKKDLSDTNGKVFAREGEQFNPLSMVQMKPLLFIDGTDEKQVQWALGKLEDETLFRHELAKIVLIKGSPIKLSESLKQDIYFDQGGILTGKFGIKYVPAMVFQVESEKVLTVREEVIK